MENQLVASLIVDEENFGYAKEIRSVDDLKEKVGELLDERVLEVKITKKKDCHSNPMSSDRFKDCLSKIDHHK